MAARKPLPHRRRSFTHKVHVGGQSVFLTCGLYPDGTLGEVFIDLAKYGSAIRQWIADYAQIFSISLQHGVPLETLVKPFRNSRSDPCGEVVGHPAITHCTSVMDFVAQVLTLEFLNARTPLDDGGDQAPPGVEDGRPARAVQGLRQTTGPQPQRGAETTVEAGGGGQEDAGRDDGEAGGQVREARSDGRLDRSQDR